MHSFPDLHVFDDAEHRSAAMNMAIDEALFETANAPSLRFYGWGRPALSFGYFGAFAEVEEERERRDVVRRWTGGGIVLHGNDLTYAVILPRRNGEVQPASQRLYAEIHGAIARALGPHLPVELATSNAPRRSAACFANPVTADVLLAGRKIAGAAQRRTRSGLLHQGSIQVDHLPESFRFVFAQALAEHVEKRNFSAELLARAEELARDKYGSETWLRQR